MNKGVLRQKVFSSRVLPTTSLRRFRGATILLGSQFFLSNSRQFASTCDESTVDVLLDDAQVLPLRCPECGKKFICGANLRQHRRTRHHLTLKSPTEEHLDELRKNTMRLTVELQKLQVSHQSSLKQNNFLSLSGVGDVGGKVFFPAAVPESKTEVMPSDKMVTMYDHPFRLGTGISEISCVGVVDGDIELGYLGDGDGKINDDQEERRIKVLQFNLRFGGYRERRIGQLKLYRNEIIVRHRSPQQVVQKGDVVLITGTYGLHKSYDIVSKQSVENVIVEAAYIGVLTTLQKQGN